MKIKNIIRLGTRCVDSASGISGMLTHINVDLNQALRYFFQPEALNPEDGQPVHGMWLVDTRLVGDLPRADMDLPLGVLGTFVEDEATHFKGKAVGLYIHISGCVHVDIQPEGTIKKTNAPVVSRDFDIRRCIGPAFVSLTAADREEDQRKKPSPGSSERCTLRTPS